MISPVRMPAEAVRALFLTDTVAAKGGLPAAAPSIPFAAPLAFWNAWEALPADIAVWLQTAAGKNPGCSAGDPDSHAPDAALLGAFGTLYLSGCSPDPAEAADFFRFSGCRTLMGNERALTPLRPLLPACRWTEAELFTLAPAAPATREALPEGFSLRRVSGIEDHRRLYTLLCSCGFSLPAFDEYYVGVFRRERAGLSGSLAAERGGEFAAAASVTAYGKAAALLGAVATLPAFRGRGLAGALVSSWAERLRAGGTAVQLACHNEAAKRVYRRLGFVSAGILLLAEWRE